MKKIFLFLIAGLLVLGISGISFAQETVNQEAGKAVDAGNKICPVSGEKIEEGTKATYEYNGKIYNFCCTSCIEEFKKEPEKYIQKVNQELHADSGQESTEEKSMTPESGMPMNMHSDQQQ